MIQIVRNAYIVIFSIMLGSVILSSRMMTGDYNNRINRVDLLVTVGNIEGNSTEVRVLIGKLISRQAHVCLAGIGPLRSIRAGEGDIPRRVVKAVGCCRRIARNGMLCSVVVSGIGRTNHIHRYIDGLDDQFTVHDVEGDCFEVVIIVCEVSGCQLHAVMACIGSADAGVTVEVKVIGSVKRGAEAQVIPGYGMSNSVIVHFPAMLCHGHRYINGIDGNAAVSHVEGNIAKVLVGIGELLLRKAHSGGAGIGPGSIGIPAEGNAAGRIQITACGNIVSAHAVGSPVIIRGFTVSGNGHGNIDGLDGHKAVSHIKGYRAEIRICIGKLARCQAHVRLSGIDPRRSCCTIEREVRFGVQRIADFNVVAADAVFRTVIIRGFILTGDLDCHIDRIDGLPTVCYVEGNSAEVVIVIGKLAGSQAHIRGSDHRPGRLRIAGEGEVRFGVQRIADFNIVAADAVFRTVIVCGTGLTLDGYARGNRIDGLITVRYVEGHVFEIRIRVGELAGAQTHVGCTLVGLLRLFVAGEGKVGFSVQRIADRHIITAHNVLLTVIISYIMMTGNGDDNIFQFGNLLITVNNIEHDAGEVIVLIAEHGTVQVHVRGSDVSPCCFRGSGEGKVFFSVQRVADLHIIAADSVFLAVKRCGIAVSGHRNAHADRIDFYETIRHIEGDIAKVFVIVDKLTSSQSHVCGAGISPCCGRRSVEGEIVRRIQIVAEGNIVAADAVFCTVIGCCDLMSGNGHRRADRTDRLITIRHFKGHCTKIRIRIGELFCRQTHICRSGIGLRCGCCTIEGEVVIHIVQRAVCCRGVSAHSMLSAVIAGRIVCTDNRYRHIDRVNGLIAIRHFKGYSAKIRIGIGKLAGSQSHLGGARICPDSFLFTVESKVVSYIVQAIVCCRSIPCYLVFCAIIIRGIIRTNDRHRHIDGADLHKTIRYIKSDIGEIAAGIDKIGSTQTHLAGSGILPGNSRRSIEGEIVFRIQRIARRYVVAFGGVILAVKVSRCIRAGNGYLNAVYRRNLLVAVCYHEGHSTEIGVVICKLTFIQAHIFGTGIFPGRHRRSVEAEIIFRIQRIADLYIITGDSMLFTVVLRGIVMAGNRYGHIDRIDLLVAVRYVEGNGTEIRIVIRELLSSQSHLGSTDNGLPGFRGAAEGKVSFRVQRIADLNIITADDVFIIVEISSVAVSGNVNGHVDLFYLLIAVGDVEGDICKVIVQVRELLAYQAHISGARVRLFGKSCSAELEVVFSVQRIADFYIISADGMLFTVIVHCAAVSSNRHNNLFNRRNRLVAV